MTESCSAARARRRRSVVLATTLTVVPTLLAAQQPRDTARTADANDWVPDHAVMSGTKDQLKAMPQFKYSDYN